MTDQSASGAVAPESATRGTGVVSSSPSRGRGWRVCVTALLLLLLGAAVTGVVDQRAGDYTRTALARAMVTFGVARTLNGLISVVQETEVAVQPAGVGIGLQPGQLLDPLNDLIERFAWVMMASGVALAAEATLLRMAAWWPANLLVLAAGFCLLWQLWRPPPADGGGRRVRQALQRFAVTLLFVRLVVPLVLVSTSALSGLFLQAEQEQATARLAEAADQVAVIAEEVESGAQGAAAPDAPLLERLGRYVGDRLAALDVEGRIERARDLLADVASHVVTLTASFLLETVLIPLLLVWLLWQLLRWSLTLAPPPAEQRPPPGDGPAAGQC